MPTKKIFPFVCTEHFFFQLKQSKKKVFLVTLASPISFIEHIRKRERERERERELSSKGLRT